MSSIDRLLQIMARLRDPQRGCPWDLEQTFGTIAPYTIEEAYEVADAIERQDAAALRDELGDLLFQVVFHAQMAREQSYLAIPMKPLCRPDCQGLCPHCGTNRNVATCTCENRWEDPRLAGLKSLLKDADRAPRE